MQIKILRLKSSNRFPVADTRSEEASARLKKLKLFDRLKAQGRSVALSLQAITWSKATYYRCLKRYWQQGIRGLEARSCRPQKLRQRQGSRQQRQAVLPLRKRTPLWGKRKIGKVLCRDPDFASSISKVSRILEPLVASGRVQRLAFSRPRKA